MQDRRSCARWQINRPAKAKLQDAEDFTSCIINDISFKGMHIFIIPQLPKDTFFKLTIVLSKEFSFNIEGWVVWHKSKEWFNAYGVYLNKVSDSDKERIYKFICKHFPAQISKCWWRGLSDEKGGDEMQDKRIFERLVAKLPLRYLEADRGRESQAQTQNISAKGVGFMANEELVPKTPLEMWIEMPDKGEPLYSRGEVVWSRMVEPDKYRVGVNLEKADLMGLSRVLRTI